MPETVNSQNQSQTQPTQTGSVDLLNGRPTFRPNQSPGNADAQPLQPLDPLQDFVRPTDSVNPNENPAFRAFLRQSGVAGARANAAIAKRLEALDRTKTRRLEDIELNQRRRSESIDTDFESRGLFSSGRRIGEHAELQVDVGRERGRFLEDLQLQLDEIEEQRRRGAASRAAAIARARNRARRQAEIDLISAVPGQITLPNFDGPR